MVDVGKNDRMSDIDAIQTTTFYKKLQKNELNLPTTDVTTEGLNFVFLGDDTLALHDNLLKSFPQKSLTFQKRIFNYRVSRAKRVVENAFGILANRFRIFHTAIHMSPDKTEGVILACCVLHNLLCKMNKAAYTPFVMVDREDIEGGVVVPGSWREENTALVSLHADHHHNESGDKETREKYVAYFNKTGAVPWQNNMA